MHGQDPPGDCAAYISELASYACCNFLAVSNGISSTQHWLHDSIGDVSNNEAFDYRNDTDGPPALLTFKKSSESISVCLMEGIG